MRMMSRETPLIAEEEERGPYDTELQDAIRRHSLREHDTVAYN